MGISTIASTRISGVNKDDKVILLAASGSSGFLIRVLENI